jgi:purine-binding chemotaxis protein CheW
MNVRAGSGLQLLLCRAGSIVCALGLDSVAETMRALPIEAISGLPEFVSGLSIVRGAPVPVVDLAKLLGDRSESGADRFVLLRLGPRAIALRVAEVMGVRTLEASSLTALPPLLGGTHAEFVSAMSRLDADLLLVLEGAKMVPESAWSMLRASAGGLA